jgi:hypothetical protein
MWRQAHLFSILGLVGYIGAFSEDVDVAAGV